MESTETAIKIIDAELKEDYSLLEQATEKNDARFIEVLNQRIKPVLRAKNVIIKHGWDVFVKYIDNSNVGITKKQKEGWKKFKNELQKKVELYPNKGWFSSLHFGNKCCLIPLLDHHVFIPNFDDDLFTL